MKTNSKRRARRQPGPQSARKFFGPEASEPFFQPMIHRAPEAKADEKKEEKVARAPETQAEEKKEEKVARVPEDKAEEKKEEEVQAAPLEPEEKRKEEKEKKISKKGEPGAAGPKTSQYVSGIHSKGQPLPSTVRAYFGDRLGYDFSAVRIHTGEEAAQSAKDASAKAYTYGDHVVFNEGRYNPESHEGRHLLAHELAHVVQQNPSRVRRQVTPTDPAVFQSRLSIALAQMTTPTVIGETLSGTLEPVLREMGANAEWVDTNGTASGGADVPVTLNTGGRQVNLRMILDDNPTPPLSGRFDSRGVDHGTIRIFVRSNDDPDILATTLYHESLHLMRWLARNAPGGDLVAETGATGGRRATLEGIDPARQPRHMAMVRRRVADLASSVNASRPGTDQIDEAGIDRTTEFVMEEYLTRIETEVFRLMRDSDAAARSRRGTVRIMTAPDTFFPRADVDKYLFEISSVFRAGDRTSLGDYENRIIDGLYDYFRDRVDMFVRRRYSEVIHGPEFP